MMPSAFQISSFLTILNRATHIKSIINQVLRNAREHVQTTDDIVYMVIDVC